MLWYTVRIMSLLESIDKKAETLKEKFGVRIEPLPVFILSLATLLMALIFVPGGVALAVSIALFLAPLWLPFLLLSGAWLTWLNLKRSEFIAKQKYILLEIKPPRNLVKTPLAMEAFLSGIHIGSGESTWYVKYIKGQMRTWYSLEIVSIEGQVHFYIWTRVNFRRLIEAHLYAQYPGVQVVEVQDYTRRITATPEEWGLWGCDFKHTDKDPIPIKTYVEYGLDKVQKEPEQTDPLANLIEFMGSMRRGEQLWLQLIIRMHKGEKYHKLNKDGKPWTWKDEAKVLVNKIREETRDVYKNPETGKDQLGFPNPTKGQIEKIGAIERNTSKLAFDVGARGVYLVDQSTGKFDPSVISGLTGIFKQFSSEGWNGFKPTGWMTKFDDYPWEIGSAKLKDKYKRWMIDAYRRRQFFYEPYESDESMVMSTEELATIYHIPSRAIEAPGLERIASATSEAPTNLPI